MPRDATEIFSFNFKYLYKYALKDSLSQTERLAGLVGFATGAVGWVKLRKVDLAITIVSKFTHKGNRTVFERPQAETLRKRLQEAPRFIVVVAGPRQIGKSTLVRQVLRNRPSMFTATDLPVTGTTLDVGSTPGLTTPQPGAAPTTEWLVQHWTQARAKARSLPQEHHYVLAIDEIQKIPRWSEVIKGLWDEDRAAGLNMHVILLGSSPWLMQRGLTESLAGRYEMIRMSHWSYPEMQEAFDFSLDEYIYFGGYPGSANLIHEETRWRQYIRDALIYPAIEKDILLMTRVDKPALLKNLFELGCNYSGQIIALSKLQGQLQGAGHVATLADYLHLLDQAGLLGGLQKYAGQKHRQRASSPKLHVHNTALMSALSGYTFTEARADRSYWGRLVESAVGAHLINTTVEGSTVKYWREGADEVDFIVESGKKLFAIEVKSAASFAVPKGLTVFAEMYRKAHPIIVGESHVPLATALSLPVEQWPE